MAITIPAAQTRIVREIKEVENALDEVMLRNAGLFTTLIVTRRETQAAPFTGHQALLYLNKTQQTLLSAGSELARVHGSLQKVQEEIVGYVPCPENEPMGLVATDDAEAA